MRSKGGQQVLYGRGLAIKAIVLACALAVGAIVLWFYPVKRRRTEKSNQKIALALGGFGVIALGYGVFRIVKNPAVCRLSREFIDVKGKFRIPWSDISKTEIQVTQTNYSTMSRLYIHTYNSPSSYELSEAGGWLDKELDVITIDDVEIDGDLNWLASEIDRRAKFVRRVSKAPQGTPTSETIKLDDDLDDQQQAKPKESQATSHASNLDTIKLDEPITAEEDHDDAKSGDPTDRSS